MREFKDSITGKDDHPAVAPELPAPPPEVAAPGAAPATAREQDTTSTTTP